MKIRKTWCVKLKTDDGKTIWCVPKKRTKDDIKRYRDSDDYRIALECGFVGIMPHGYEYRTTTCRKCREALSAHR